MELSLVFNQIRLVAEWSFLIAKLLDLRFMCVIRFKLWWMTQRMGSFGQEIPFETQFLIVQGKCEDGQVGVEKSDLYIVFLPILEGDFRAVLQGNANNELEICLESGDPALQEFDGSHLVYVAAGGDPFDVITSAVKTVEGHLQTFCHRERKKMPDMLNFVRMFQERRGIPAKIVIIDDGWQSVGMDPVSEAKADNTANFANRLTNIKENYKFQKDGKEGQRIEDPTMGIRHIVNVMKDEHSVKYVYVWHALAGYWGGVKPGVKEMDHYESKMAYPISSPAVESTEADDALDAIIKFTILQKFTISTTNYIPTLH